MTLAMRHAVHIRAVRRLAMRRMSHVVHHTSAVWRIAVHVDPRTKLALRQTSLPMRHTLLVIPLSARAIRPPLSPVSLKDDLKTALIAHLSTELDSLEKAHRATLAGATHDEAKPENDKDTRALEQSYLARGQAARVEEQRAAIAEVAAFAPKAFADRPAAVGALVTVEDEGEEATMFLAPAGGGVSLAAGKVQVVTPRSPLGRALLGKRTGDDTEVTVAGKTRTLSIVRVV
jgi:transcription elongation GreA/GreB family factor